MKSRWTIALLLVMLLGASTFTHAQGTVNLSIDDLQLDEFPRAKCMVTVRDANGVPITGMGADQSQLSRRFEIVEDGRVSFPPDEVEMQVNPDAVISVIMVIDISGSMKGKPLEEAIRASNALLDQLNAQDRAAVVAFADEVQSLDPAVLEEEKELGFTTDKNAIRNVVNFLDTKIGWDTPLYDAIYKGVKMAASEPAGKRAVVVMTDGRDERDNAEGVPVKDAGSLSTADDPINEANRHNIPIFSIGLYGVGGQIDTKYLQRLAERTGGVYQEAPQPEELTPLFENVANQLKTQYVLSYESRAPEDAHHHSLMVRVNLPQGQDFDEIKFQVLTEVPPPPAPTQSEVEGSVAAAPTELSETIATESLGGTGAQSGESTAEPSSGGLEVTLESIRDTIQERPLLAVVIGVGLLLLIVLLIALLVVLLRGSKPEAEEYHPFDAPAAITDPYSPPPAAWSPGPRNMQVPTDPGTPTMGSAIEEKTEVAPSAWPEPGPAVSPFGPVPGGAGRDDISAAGETRVIERGPQHLAILVDKAQPDRRYDLKGTMNIGRARTPHGGNQIVVEDATVSRQHAWIKAEGDSFLIFDVGSANGTFVNGEQIEEPRYLENGDIVRFGDVEFVFTKVF